MATKKPKLLPCPFCGGEASCEYWHGGTKQKRMIACNGEDCQAAPAVTGETKAEAVKKWNTRAVCPGGGGSFPRK